MKKEKVSSLRKTLLLLTTAAAALGVSVGLPMKKVLAASQELKTAPSVMKPSARLTIIQPERVDPSTVRLLKIAEQALSNKVLAGRIFSQPDVVAKQYHLSNTETLVLRHMDQTQFQAARSDAASLVARRRSQAGSMHLPPGAANAQLITERMIVGRAILAAVGRSYLEAANAHDCCPWSKAIELGVTSDPAVYNEVFQKPAGVNIQQPGVKINRPGVKLSR